MKTKNLSFWVFPLIFFLFIPGCSPEQPEKYRTSPWPQFRHDRAHSGQASVPGLEAGNVYWSYTTGGGITSSPAISGDNRVAIGSSDNNLYCFTTDGKLLWIYNTGGEVRSSPAFDEMGRVYCGSNSGYIFCLSPGGKLVWSYLAGGHIRSSPVLARNGTVYIGSNNGKIYSIDRGGRLLWSYKT
ncbi:MAG: PQQ-like beta-propeller repeat protein, partial [Candidatus Eremiobacteraeota bacterium]|nr:PQQ-like beta-propeller repeat protein [Candidatus Eremiobacteraeota bacterium]